MEKVIVGSVEQVGDDRHVIATVTESFAASQQRVKTRAVLRWRGAKRIASDPQRYDTIRYEMLF